MLVTANLDSNIFAPKGDSSLARRLYSMESGERAREARANERVNKRARTGESATTNAIRHGVLMTSKRDQLSHRWRRRAFLDSQQSSLNSQLS